MATSSSRDFDLDVGELIEEAYERCGLEMRTGYDAKTARRSLNLMFADWANRGLNLWTVTQETKAVTSGTATYTLSSEFVDLLEVVLRNSSGTDFTLTQMSRGEYLRIPNKDNTGQPSQYFFVIDHSQTYGMFFLVVAQDLGAITMNYHDMCHYQKEHSIFSRKLVISVDC